MKDHDNKKSDKKWAAKATIKRIVESKDREIENLQKLLTVDREMKQNTKTFWMVVSAFLVAALIAKW